MTTRSPETLPTAMPADRRGGSPTLLHELPRGVPAVIEAVATDGPLARRLADLGFLPGTRVAMIRRAPLGDPTVYEVRGTQLCLRRSEAAGIRVWRLDPGAAAGAEPRSRAADPGSREAELRQPTPDGAGAARGAR